MGGREDPLAGDEGTAAEVHVVDEESRLVGPRVWRGLNATHDAGRGCREKRKAVEALIVRLAPPSNSRPKRT